MLKWFTPSAYVDSIYHIDIENLNKLNVKGLIIDLDNTLIPRDEEETPQKLLAWLNGLEKKGFKVCVVSNNTNSRGRLISEKLNLPVISMAKKPAKAAFNKALGILKTTKEETVVVGDQLFTDVLGGNRMKLKTILVVSLGGKDFFATVLMRKLERVILNRLSKKKGLEKNNLAQFREIK